MGWGDSFNDLGKALFGIDGLDALNFVMKNNLSSASYNKVGKQGIDVIKAALNAEIINKEYAEKLIKTVNSGDADFILKQTTGDELSIGGLADLLISNENTTDAVKKIGSNYNDISSKYGEAVTGGTEKHFAEFLGIEEGKAVPMGTIASGYFGDKKYGKARQKAGLAATSGVMVAGRLLSGGDLFRTNTGERDIAGIPFI